MMDMDAVSFAHRGEGDVRRKLPTWAPSEVCISAVTLAALRYGTEDRRSQKLSGLIDTFVRAVVVMPSDASAAVAFGVLAAELTRTGNADRPPGHDDRGTSHVAERGGLGDEQHEALFEGGESSTGELIVRHGS